MVSAWVMGILGAITTYWIGSHSFGLSLRAGLLAVLASNVAGFFALLLTLWLERRAWVRRYVMGHAFMTWAVLFVLYVSFTVALNSTLRDPLLLAALLLPMIWSTGLMLPLWGPVQDRLIRWERRRAEKPEFADNQRFARRRRDAIRAES
jgi:putative effector of murein hydrolase LrgA (UPF0299 family)